MLSNSQLTTATQLHNVPFYAQEKYQCGPAALAMMLGHVGTQTTPEALIRQVYLPARKGSLQIEILASVRSHHLVPYVIEPQLDQLLREIEAGNPVLVLQNLGLSWAPVWHYAVVIGYDLRSQQIILHSGLEQAKTTALKTFERTWARASHWGLVITPIDQIPASAEPHHYLKAIADLQPHDKNKHRAYATAARHWPTEFLPQLSLGNSFYNRGELPAAERTYRAAISIDPTSAIALNNLAQTLADQNKLGEALSIIQQALTIGGPFQQKIQNTLNEIKTKQTSH